MSISLQVAPHSNSHIIKTRPDIISFIITSIDAYDFLSSCYNVIYTAYSVVDMFDQNGFLSAI